MLGRRDVQRVAGQPPLPERGVDAERWGDSTDAETSDAGTDGPETELTTEASEGEDLSAKDEGEEDDEMLEADDS